AGRAARVQACRGPSAPGRPRGGRGSNGDDLQAYRRPARARRRTTSGSCSARRRGTWPPDRASASRCRSLRLGAGRGSTYRESTQTFRFFTHRPFPLFAKSSYGVTVEPGPPDVGTWRVRSNVTV